MSPLLRSSNWPVEWPLFAIAATAVLYLLGGRASASRRSGWREASFYGGLATLALAIDSPVDTYSDSLFWVHMVQHVLLMMVAPPLLLMGRPWPRVSRGLPLSARRPIARTVLVGPALSPARRAYTWLAAPVQAFVLFNAVLLAWHLPALYDLTLREGLVHYLEHGLFFATGLLFWSHLVPTGRATRLTDVWRVGYAVGGLLVGWALAVVLGFAPDPIYSAYASLPSRPLGISALTDQQLAAGVMWVPASIPYTIAIFTSAYRWLDPAAGQRRRRLTADDLRPRET